MKRSIVILVAVAAAIVTSAMASTVAFAAGGGFTTTPGIAPPAGSPLGATYGTWSARWWQWAYGLPVHGPDGQIHQFFAPDGPIDCSYGQSGHVWYLTGTFQATESNGQPVFEANRSCSIPYGTALFLPILNDEYDNLSIPPAPPTTLTVDQLRAEAAAGIDSIQSMFATVDGRSVSDLAGPSTPYRAISPVFSYTLPADNVYVAEGLPIPAETVAPPGAVADGAYIMIAPLSKGTHVLHWGGVIPDALGPGVPFIQDITYTVTVSS
jgi:hypothetical protein